MTFKEEMKERTEVIEKLLVKYLPKAGSLCYNACIRKELWGQPL